MDAKQVGIEGHSRYGKAALVAMAYDPRFAIGLHQLLRRRRRQAPPPQSSARLVENVAGSGEYHWMAGNFLKYAGPLTVTTCPWMRTS